MEFKDPKWRFGSSPAYDFRIEKRFTWGSVVCLFVLLSHWLVLFSSCFPRKDFRFDVSGGVIRNVAIFSDILFPQLITQAKKTLIGFFFFCFFFFFFFLNYFCSDQECRSVVLQWVMCCSALRHHSRRRTSSAKWLSGSRNPLKLNRTETKTIQFIM